MGRKVIDSFTVGGTKAGVSMPGARLQQMLGNTIKIDIYNHVLFVPTDKGTVIAGTGDRILLYDDDTLEVRNDD